MSVFRCPIGNKAVASSRKRLAVRVEFLANAVRSIWAQTNIGGFISRPLARARSVRGSKYKRFHLLAPLAVPPSKHGPLVNIGGLISHPMARLGSVRGSEYKRFHLPALLAVPPSKHGTLTNILLAAPSSNHWPLANIGGLISRPLARVGSDHVSDYKQFHLPAPLAVQPSKHGRLMNIGGLISRLGCPSEPANNGTLTSISDLISHPLARSDWRVKRISMVSSPIPGKRQIKSE
ncbi:hypothetical protein CQZ98_17830 [Pseudomonas sp. MYb115]|nr:hypothetical protein CQZ98_17830 [Pseudomonas sp. MYb115]